MEVFLSGPGKERKISPKKRREVERRRHPGVHLRKGNLLDPRNGTDDFVDDQKTFNFRRPVTSTLRAPCFGRHLYVVV